MSSDAMNTRADAVVVGGGPAGATAAEALARQGHSVVLIEREGRIKPCGGAIPPRLVRDFAIPEHLLCARVSSARMLAPSHRAVDMPIEDGWVGMVDRDVFDGWLRQRAWDAGAIRATGTFRSAERRDDGALDIVYDAATRGAAAPDLRRVRTRLLIGADGAKSEVARQCVPESAMRRHVFAYHEIVEAPHSDTEAFSGARADVYYQGALSPDFYAWVFPHGRTASIGVGTAVKGQSLRGAIRALRGRTGLDACRTVRTEGAPLPLQPIRRWDNGRDVVLAGDAAGVVAPASGEGIYYAMVGGLEAAHAGAEALRTGRGRALSQARVQFMKAHGRVFWILGMMQHFWYRDDRRRERFVSMCADPDVQHLTWQAYMNKELVKARPGAHMRIFLKDMGHLLGLSPA